MSIERVGARQAIVETARNLVIYVGSIGLLVEMVVVFITALMRNLGLTFPGSIEVVETIIVVVASAALVMTTLATSHATVRLVIDRVSPKTGRILHCLTHLLGAFFWLLMAVAGFWILTETWGEEERTMLMGIPLAPLRTIWLVACIFMMGLLLGRTFTFPRREGHDA